MFIGAASRNRQPGNQSPFHLEATQVAVMGAARAHYIPRTALGGFPVRGSTGGQGVHQKLRSATSQDAARSVTAAPGVLSARRVGAGVGKGLARGVLRRMEYRAIGRVIRTVRCALHSCAGIREHGRGSRPACATPHARAALPLPRLMTRRLWGGACTALGCPPMPLP